MNGVKTVAGGETLPPLCGVAAAVSGDGTAKSGGPKTTGVIGIGDMCDGVDGFSQGGDGVAGVSQSGAGVRGTSSAYDGVYGETQSKDYAGVTGVNKSGGPGVHGLATAMDGVHGDSQSNVHAGVSGQNYHGGPGVYGQAGIIGKGTPGPAGQFVGYVYCGTGATIPQGDYQPGSLYVENDVVLINADCAEDFDVAGDQQPEPGTVMVIDDNGVLKPAEQAYDKRVGGIISGAGTCRPAIVLNRKAKLMRAPLALLGTVYCKVDCEYGAIEVGDLLTTSVTPGHAMKVVDPLKAFGTVIGKALRPLSSGKGLVPVLVALQ